MDIKSRVSKREHYKSIRQHEFDSFGELLDFIEATPTDWQSRSSEKDRGKVDRWSGTPSIAEAKRLGREGWVQGVDKLGAALTIAERGVEARVRSRVYDVAGDEFDVEQFIEGQPELFEVEQVKRSNKRRSITLRISGSFNCQYGADEATTYGAAVVALVRAIEDSGNTRCELKLEFPAEAGGCFSSCNVIVKHAGEDLDLISLAFPLVHPSSLRRINFAYTERAFSWREASDLGFNFGYGRAVPQLEPEDGERDVYVVPALEQLIKFGGAAEQRAALVRWWNAEQEAAE